MSIWLNSGRKNTAIGLFPAIKFLDCLKKEAASNTEAAFITQRQ